MKKFIAIILSLAVVIGVCSIGASAAEVGEYVHWQTKTDGAYVMKLDGKFGVGETLTLTSKNLDFNAGLYYELEIPEDGCYKVTCDAEEYEISEYYDYSDYYDTPIAYGYEEYALNEDNSRIYYLTKGTLLFKAESWYEDDIKETGSVVTIEKYDGERPEATYDACDYIDEIIVSDLEYYAVSYEYYDGRYSFSDPRANGDKIEVIYKDGSTKLLANYKQGEEWITIVELPNGEEFEVIIYQDVTKDNDVYFVVAVDEYEYIRCICDIVEDDRKANTEYLKKNISENVRELRSDIEQIFLAFKYNDGSGDLIYNAFSLGFLIRDIFDNISAYIRFCL